MDKKEASEQIAALTSEAMDLIRKAEQIADASGVNFSFDIAYGMGGEYLPESSGEQPYTYAEEFGWQPSSQSY